MIPGLRDDCRLASGHQCELDTSRLSLGDYIRDVPPPPVSRSRLGFALGGSAVLLPALLYFNALPNPFVYDDYRTVVENLAVHHLADLGSLIRANLFRPVLALSYAIDAERWGLEPFGFHVTNVVLHTFNVALLFLFTWRAVEDSREGVADSRGHATAIAGLAAVLFAVHPMMTQAVGYVSGRSEVLCGTWFLLGLLAMRQGLASGRARWIVIACVALALGLATKEVAAMLPLVALVYDRVLLQGPPEARRRRLVMIHVPLLTLVVLAAAIRAATYLFLEARPTFVPRWTPWQYFLTQFHVVWRYVFLLVAPLWQSIFHSVRLVTSPFDLMTVTSAIGLLLSTVLAVRVRRHLPLLTFGMAWFLLLLVPSSSVIPLQELMSEHRVYLASAGFFIAVAAATSWMLARVPAAGAVPRLAVGVLLVLVVGTLSGLTVARNRVWASPAALWRDAARKGPTAWAYFNLGNALREDGDCVRAIPAYKSAIRLNPSFVPAYPDLGACLIELGRLEEARRVLTAALELDPALAATRESLAALARAQGTPESSRQGGAR